MVEKTRAVYESHDKQDERRTYMALIRARLAHGTDREFVGHLHIEVDATGTLLLKSDTHEPQETPTVVYACANGVWTVVERVPEEGEEPY